MLEVQYQKTGTKEKPSYKAHLVVHDPDLGHSTLRAILLAEIEKTERAVEGLGSIPCWRATTSSGDIERKTLGALKAHIESNVFETIASGLDDERQLTLPFEPKVRGEKNPNTMSATEAVEAQSRPPFGSRRES